ncbi:unnamed protein product [Lactuca saligna]|uniref:Aminoacyl-tRNA synthetase class Ia domain-containing protein n=1 Tax=Lactuca saligna TaxID=75948 RepID=A0AA35ZUE3_LACSI|nr:unnamed protein product [Lactuca saligna]
MSSTGAIKDESEDNGNLSDGGVESNQIEGNSSGKSVCNWWDSQGHFKPNFDKGYEPFVVTMQPPNVTGSLHMRHAMFVTLEVWSFDSVEGQDQVIEMYMNEEVSELKKEIEELEHLLQDEEKCRAAITKLNPNNNRSHERILEISNRVMNTSRRAGILFLVVISSQDLKANHSIQQHVDIVTQNQKYNKLVKLLDDIMDGSRILIFMDTKKGCDQITRQLRMDG